ncbi:MAG: DMT family transporter [Comamonadaceae bacterium]|nr:MAG: DMT family transporter [Comamonadaceae bacterium]
MQAASPGAVHHRGSSLPKAPPVLLRGIAFYVSGLWLLSTLDTASKVLVGVGVPVLMVAWFRYLGHMVLMATLVMPRVGRAELLRTKSLPRQLVRGALMITTTVLFFTLLRHAPIAEATAFNFIAPLIILMVAPWLLGERNRWWRWAGVAAGVAGMLLVVRPGGVLSASTAALGVVTAISFACFHLSTRRVAHDAPLTTNFYGGLFGAVALTAALPFFWQTPDLSGWQWVLLVSTGILGFAAHWLQIIGFKHAPASVLAPYTYLQIVAATALGWAVFGQLPDAVTASGMALICVAGLAVAVLDARASRRAAQGAAVSPPQAGSESVAPGR